MTPQELLELESRLDLATARLGVAENLGWVVATLAALCVYLYWRSWIPSVLVFYPVYLLCISPWNREYETLKRAFEDANRRDFRG